MVNTLLAKVEFFPVFEINIGKSGHTFQRGQIDEFQGDHSWVGNDRGTDEALDGGRHDFHALFFLNLGNSFTNQQVVLKEKKKEPIEIFIQQLFKVFH